MKKRCFVSFVILALFLLALAPLTARADDAAPYFTYSLDKQSATSGELVKLKINANTKADTAAGFRMMISYDAAAISFVRTETSSQIKSGTMVTNGQINPIYSIYVCDVDQNAAPVLSGNIISFVFKVNDNVKTDQTSISAQIYDGCNYQAKQIDVNCNENLTLKLQPENQLSDEAYLTALTPLEGTLMPAFSQEVFAYSMRVDYDVTSVEFAASAGETGTVKINRKSLQKAGSATSIIVTVTAADKKNTSQYVIVVSRAQKPLIVSAESSDSITKGTTSSLGKSVKSRAKAGTSNPSPITPTTGAQANPAETPAEKSQKAETPVASAQQQPGYTGRGDRNIYIIGNQMPAYTVGLLAACLLCVSMGITLGLWLKIKAKNEIPTIKAKSIEAVDPIVSKIKKIKWIKKTK